MSADILSQLEAIIKARTQEYSKHPIRDIEYALNRLGDGEAIDPHKLQGSALRDYLVQLNETEEAINRIITEIDASKNLRGYTFVVGEYGSGKSQLRELLIDNSSFSNVITIKADLGLTSFGSFALEFCKTVREYINANNNQLLPHINPQLVQIEKSSTDAETYRNFVQALQSITKTGLSVFFHLDEVDMIPNLEAFTPWANFFVMLNQHIEAGVHIVFYMAPRDIHRLWDKDSRLNRFSRYISKAISPGKTFGNKVVDAVAQILSMYEVVNDKTISSDMLQLLAQYLAQYTDIISRSTLRKVNTDSYQIAEFLANLQTKNYWKSLAPAFQRPTPLLAETVENSIKQVLTEIPLEFEFNDVIYQTIFDGAKEFFNIIRLANEEKVFVTKIPCRIVYVIDDNYQDKMKLLKGSITQNQPFCLYTLVSLSDIIEKQLFYSEFPLENNPNILHTSLYPSLIHPLVLFSHPEYASDYILKRQLQFWFDLTSNSKNQLRLFFEEIVKQLYESELQKQLEELRLQMGITITGPAPEVSVQTRSTTQVIETQGRATSRASLDNQQSVSNKITQTEIEVLLRVMAIFSHNTAKKKENVIKEVSDDLRRQKIMNVTDGQIDSVIKRLVQKDYLRETSTQYRKTSSWENKAIFKSFNLQ